MLKNRKGITLIALAITIVVLMILAGVSITMVTDDEGVVTKANTAAQETELAGIKEDIQKEITRAIVAERGNLSDSELEEVLKNYGELNSDKTTLITNPSKTNTEYSYEIKLSELYLGNTTEDDVTKYTVRFYNYDGTFLAQTRVKAGTVASYSGATPTKTGTETTTYTFANKWATEKGGTEEADVSSVQKDMDVYAMFNESVVENADKTAPTVTLEEYAVSTGSEFTVTINLSNVEESDYPITINYYKKLASADEYTIADTTQILESGTTDSYMYDVNSYTSYTFKVEVVDSSNNMSFVEGSAGTGCFVAGTKVLTEAGIKNIEDIIIGEKVYSINLENNQRELKEVTNLYKGLSDEIFELTINNQLIKATPKHQFYVVDKGWIRAYEIEEGDKLVAKDEEMIITKVGQKFYENPVDVYNLTVSGNHNYLITEYELLVHNLSSPSFSMPIEPLS